MTWPCTTPPPARLAHAQGHVGRVYAVAFSPDGTRLVSGCFQADNTARVWNVATGELVATCTAHNACVVSVVFSPDGKCVASGSSERRSLRLGSRTRATKSCAFRDTTPRWAVPPTDAVGGVAFSPDGIHIVSVSQDKQR